MKKISQCGKRIQTDVLVIGAGIAGLSYALELSTRQANVKIDVFIKDSANESNSLYAQGGIAAVSLEEDSIAQHMLDTKNAGSALCQPEVVRNIVEAGPAAIDFLIEHGVQFDRQESGEPDLAKEGGHSCRRIFHYKDITGIEVSRGLTNALKTKCNIKIHEFNTVVNLITAKTENELSTVIGAYILDEKTSLIHTVMAKVVVIATGGIGKVYRYTTNPNVATGDGVAMAFRAGARVSNMEFIQFHPTLLYHPQRRNFLITEALRGEGAYLRSPDTGERFMQKYAKDSMELATRDVIARAIFTEIERSDKNFVYLDIRHKDKHVIKTRFPVIYKTLLSLGIDMTQEMIPVVPGAHYMCGGILTDINGQTDLQGLLAIGEVACSGMHGANRLASNSLLEAVVMARQAAEYSEKYLQTSNEIKNESAPLWDSESVVNLRRASQINAHWRGLRGEMMSYAGVIRTQAGLEDLLKLIKTRAEMVEEYYWKHTITRDLIELRNIILVATLIVNSAMSRDESRGGHYREDYPKENTKVKDSLMSVVDFQLEGQVE